MRHVSFQYQGNIPLPSTLPCNMLIGGWKTLTVQSEDCWQNASLMKKSTRVYIVKRTRPIWCNATASSRQAQACQKLLSGWTRDTPVEAWWYHIRGWCYKLNSVNTLTASTLSHWPFSCSTLKILAELDQYHVCWRPGSVLCQAFSIRDIDCVG